MRRLRQAVQEATLNSTLSACSSVIEKQMSAPWTTDWDSFVKRFPVLESGQERLKELAETPAELAFLSRAELAQLWQQGFMKRATFIRLMFALDSWDVVGALLSLSADDVAALAENFLRPSELSKQLSPPMPVHFKVPVWRDIIKVSGELAAPKCELAAAEDVPPADFFSWPVKRTPVDYNALGDAFSAIVQPIASHEVVGCQGALDEALASALGPVGPTIRAELAQIPPGDRTKIRALRFGIGYIGDLKPLVECLDEFENVCLIDLHINRIEATDAQFGYLKSLVQVMAARKGACIVFGNPIASFDANEFLAQFASEAPSNFCHLIWIPESWVAGKAWLGVLGQASKLAPMVILAHRLVYHLIM